MQRDIANESQRRTLGLGLGSRLRGGRLGLGSSRLQRNPSVSRHFHPAGSMNQKRTFLTGAFLAGALAAAAVFLAGAFLAGAAAAAAFLAGA